MITTEAGTRARREELFTFEAASLFRKLLDEDLISKRYFMALDRKVPYLDQFCASHWAVRFGRNILDRVGFLPIVPFEVSQEIDQHLKSWEELKAEIEATRKSLIFHGRDKPGMHKFNALSYRMFCEPGEECFQLAFTIRPLAAHKIGTIRTEGFFSELQYQTWDQAKIAVNIPETEGSAPILLIPENTGLHLQKQTVYPMGSFDPEEWEEYIFQPESTLKPLPIDPEKFQKRS